MDQADQSKLLDRVVEHIRSGSRDVEAAPSSFSARNYCDEDRIAQESATLFSDFPVVVAASAQFPQEGSFIARQINGVPVLLSRQADGTIRGYLNVCLHRGAVVVPEGAGTCEGRHVCPYHAWAYGIDGRLRATPKPDNFEGLDLGALHLKPLATAEIAGLIFVLPNHRSSIDFNAYFGEYGRELAGFGIADFDYYDGRTTRMNHDWKMTIEGNQETYHFNALHRSTAGRRFWGELSLFDHHGPHTRSLMMHKRFQESVLPQSRDDWRVLEHGDVVYSLFPNTLVLLSHFAAHVLSVFPDGLGKAKAHGFTLVPPGTADSFKREFFDVYWSTMLEDIEVSETIQISAAAVPEAVWWRGRNEHLIRRFNASIDAALAGDLTAASVCAELGSPGRDVS